MSYSKIKGFGRTGLRSVCSSHDYFMQDYRDTAGT